MHAIAWLVLLVVIVAVTFYLLFPPDRHEADPPREPRRDVAGEDPEGGEGAEPPAR